MKLIKNGLIALSFFIGVVGISTLLVTHGVSATAASEILGGSNATGQGGGNSLQQNLALVVNVLLFIIGAIAVIVIIIGGLKYVTSDGDSAKVKSAKDTILYAIVGIIIALLAYALVNFVITSFVKA